MAEGNDKDNVLGIQTTIDSSEIEKGVNDFIRKITEMEKATDQAVGAMSGKFKSFNDEIQAVASSIEKSRTEFERVLNIGHSRVTPSIQQDTQSTGVVPKASYVESSGKAIERNTSRQKQLNKTLREQEKQYDANAKKLSELEDRLLALQQAEERGVQKVMRGNASVPIADSIRQLTEEYEKLREVQSSLQAEIDQTNEALSQSDEAAQSLQEQESVLVRLLGGAENYKEIIKALPAPIKNAADNINQMTGAAKKFVATPLGAILAALILAFQAVKSYLTQTADGQMKLAQATGFLTGVLKPFKELVISIGKSLVDAFTKPKQTVKDLWEAIKKQVTAPLEGLIDVVSNLGAALGSAFKGDWDSFKQSMKGVGDGFLKIGTVADNAGKKIADFGKKVVKSGQESANIALETRQLDLQIKEWEKRRQQLEAKKQQTRGQISNTSLSTKERKAAAVEYEKILEEEYKMDLHFINKRIELKNRSMALGSHTQEDKQALADLEAEREQIKANYQRSLAERQDTNGALINAEREALIELGNMQAELEISNQKRVINAMKDGHDKKMAELEAEYLDERQKLDELEDKFVKQNRRAGVDTGEDGLTDVQRSLIAQARKDIELKHGKDVKMLLKQELDDILTYEQERTKLQEQFQEKRKAIYQEGTYTYNSKGFIDGGLLKEGVTRGNEAELERQEKEGLKAIDEKFASQSEAFLAWSQTIADMSIKQLVIALETAKSKLNEVQGSGTATEQELAQARATIAKLEEQIKKVDAKAATDTRSIEKWKDLKDVLSDVSGEFQAMGDAIGGSVGKALGTIGSLSTDTIGLINNIFEFSDMCQKGIMKISDGAISAIKAVESASVILAIISAAIQIITKVVNLAKEAHNQTYEDNIEEHQRKIDDLSKSYDKLSEKLDETFGAKKVQNLKEMNDYLEQQNRLIQSQKDEEAQIKQKDEDYEQKVKSYDEAMESNRKQIEDNKKAMEEAIFGSDIQSAIQDFANAYGDAVASNMSLNESAKEQAVKAMKQMVMESIKEYIAGSAKMEEIRAKMKALYADGVFSESDQKVITDLYEQLGKEVDERFAWAESLLEDSTSSSGSKGRGIATASQESVDENNGRLMSLQITAETLRSLSEQQTALQQLISFDTATIRRDMEIQNKYISEIVDIQYESVEHLSAISKNTRQLYQMNERLGQIEANTKRL